MTSLLARSRRVRLGHHDGVNDTNDGQRETYGN